MEAGRGVRAWKETFGPTQAWWGFLFVLPMLLLLAVFKFWPMAYAGWLSLTDANLTEPTRKFVGTENYSNLAHDTVFVGALKTTAYYVGATITPSLLVGLGLALLVNTRVPIRGVFRVLLFLPAVIPIIVVPILWQFLFNPYGLVNDGLNSVGIPSVNWLLSVDGVVPALVIATTWRLAPLCMVIFLAGLQSIPENLYEAAEVDGASPVRRFWTITLPMLKPTVLVALIFAVTLTVQNFVLALVMTNGGPDNASTTVSFFVYETGFLNFRMGYASAAAMIMLLILVTVTIVSLRLLRTDEAGA